MSSLGFHSFQLTCESWCSGEPPSCGHHRLYHQADVWDIERSTLTKSLGLVDLQSMTARGKIGHQIANRSPYINDLETTYDKLLASGLGTCRRTLELVALVSRSTCTCCTGWREDDFSLRRIVWSKMTTCFRSSTTRF
jgi:hypothetical protein